MNHYMALTSLKSNKSQNGVLGFSRLENAQKGTCIVDRVLYQMKVKMFWGAKVSSDWLSTQR